MRLFTFAEMTRKLEISPYKLRKLLDEHDISPKSRAGNTKLFSATQFAIVASLS